MSSYSDFIIRRLLASVPVMIGLSMLIFFISRILPGSPVRLALGPTATDEQVEMLRQQMGLDQPIPIQYVDWLAGVLTGDWGTSLRTGNNVFHDLAVRLPATIELVLVSLTMALIIAIPFGVIAGTNKDKWQDHASRFVALSGVSFPRFWLALLLQLLFAAYLNILPIQGRISDHVQPPPSVTNLYLADSLIAGQWATFIDVTQHIMLPATALGFATLAQIMRLLRSDMIEQERKDYIMAARVYGLPDILIKYKYMLKNAFTSTLTVIGLVVGFLIGNAFFIELIFSWPGMATYGVQAILRQDFNAIVGVVIIVGVTYVSANIVVDLLYGYIDPRVRYQEEG
jgi:peptide/nickel transport system permease protein